MSVQAVCDSFIATRQQFLRICDPLDVEDYGLQAAEFASPPKWHLAHTSWFFETFLLKQFAADYVPLDPRYEVLFNSYYNGIGDQHPRGQRGLLSRPSLADVLAYRDYVDQAMVRLLSEGGAHKQFATILERTVMGIEHERQHQELFFTDLKYSLGQNPMYPAYTPGASAEGAATAALEWTAFDGGLVQMGFCGEGFCFDNEQPRHQVYLEPFALANRLVTNAEYQAFIDDGGYTRPELWLADGWATVKRDGWRRPLHWLDAESTAGRSDIPQGQPLEFTLYGVQRRSPATPVTHVSGYEADAYARWAGLRLPTEPEWEHAAMHVAQTAAPVSPSLSKVHPEPATNTDLQQLYGECWQWTQSAYSPYPGFSPSEGAIGEYNGKFMSNQWVLRGGSCVTPVSQARPSYRNFFYPQDRWQFSGIRMAKQR